MLEFLRVLADEVKYASEDGRLEKLAVIAQEQINQKITVFHQFSQKID